MAGSAFFLMRLNDHVQYLKKIDNTLKGKGDFEGCTYDVCKLGVWINQEGPQEVAKLSDSARAGEILESIKEPHKRFHDVSHEVLEKQKAGDQASAVALVTEMHRLSTEISNKLLELDKMS